MPREDKEIEEERKAKSAYDLIRIRLDRLEKNIDKLVPIPSRREAPKPKAPPEFVRNVVGSSAAAGSAEFHIFRNNRRKEMNRLEYIEKEAIREELDEEYERKQRERKELEEAKTAKKRQKRQRRKEHLKNAKKSKKPYFGKVEQMKNLLQVCAFGPRLYTLLFDGGGTTYSPNLLETVGSMTLAFSDAVKTFCIASSPLIVPYLFMRYEPMAVVGMLNSDYRTFAQLLVQAYDRPSLEARNRLKLYDYESSAYSITDFEAKKRASKWYPAIEDEDGRHVLPEPFHSLRGALAFWAAHSFGRRMLFPGSLSLLKSAIGGALIDARHKFLTSREAQRNVLRSEDGNLVDSLFWDRRGKSDKGDTLVICFEGNAGFYEVGIAATPNALRYSVLGWNTPGFGESTGQPFPTQITNAADAVMQFATEKLGFAEANIVLYAWSIGGFSASWVAANYPNVKAVILDASFDDLVPLALARMPSFARSVVHYTVRKYLNLPVARQLNKYTGPIRFIRRWNEEIIIDDAATDAESRRASNRANFLLIGFLRNRYPGLLLEAKDEQLVKTWLALDPQSRVLMFNSDEPTLPQDLDTLDHVQRSVLIQQLCNKHFLDFDASHNIPLNALYFNIPVVVRRQFGGSFTGVGNVLGTADRKNSRDSIQTLSSLSSTTSESDSRK